MLRLLCDGANKQETQSRIAVLDIGDPKYDFGFATGHAIPPERPCAVKDFDGKQRSVDLIRLADGYKSGEKTDWAIIRFDKISTRQLVRYQLEPVEDFGPLNQQIILFARAMGLPENAQPCMLDLLDFKNGFYRMTHDCRAVRGQSGSPLTRIVDGKHKLVGLHVGHLWMFPAPDTGRPDRRGYVNLVNRDTISEIQTIIAQNRS